MKHLTLHSSLFTLHLYAILCLLLMACTQRLGDDVMVSDEPAPIYPDYTDVTIPANIAPLNFLVRDESCEAVQATVCLRGKKAANVQLLTVNANGNKVVFGMKEWKQLMDTAAGKELEVCLTVLTDGRWRQFKPFTWHVAKEKLDPILTYRLIEPDYEIWSNVELWERNVENFDERTISSYQKVGDRCMNCHTFSNQDPALSMLYVRGEGGGAILNQNGNLSKLALKADDMVSGSVYFGFSPNGRYIAFSTNLIFPAFHSRPDKRLEVFDSKSDVYVADLQSHTFLRSPLLADSLVFETFPTFSPDGKYIYYCAAPRVKLPGHIRQLQYRLCRIPFDQQTGRFGTQVDTLQTTSDAEIATSSAEGDREKASVCHPRISPDGRWLLYTVAYYGTFPIWHPEADQRMMDLKTGKVQKLDNVNSHKSDTYHSWSSNSRWFVFASKRDDGLYGKPYFCYVDANGKAHKPFSLPQKDPERYDNMLKSFNAPELGRAHLPFTDSDVADAMKLSPVTFR